ncbi:hypothetical protein SKAU_G00139640 [Synaphobranchus kaupii]|uniref:Uncharacterized protein n=1 Tax=Synaphobranchus kaupii TaxID=118154 RepID=A0A9Q1J447_SYNKA|nr:hypothetical protein SKAU_G00139640 [Synaphobranchus kaupii]
MRTTSESGVTRPQIKPFFLCGFPEQRNCFSAPVSLLCQKARLMGHTKRRTGRGGRDGAGPDCKARFCPNEMAQAFFTNKPSDLRIGTGSERSNSVFFHTPIKVTRRGEERKEETVSAANSGGLSQ